MRKSFSFLGLWVCSLFLLVACDNDELPPLPPVEGSRTVLAYFASDNNLSSFVSADLEEMKLGMTKVNDSNARLLVYIDTDNSPRLIELKKEDGRVVETTVKTYEDRNSVGVVEMREVFDDVFWNDKYRAESYGLIYWSHGDGWIPYPTPSSRWVGQDIGSGDKRMNISGLVDVLERAPHFDFIMFDACFMQSIEVAYELRSFCDYYIGFPSENPGPGAAYDQMFPYMFQKGSAVKMAEATFKVYDDLYTGRVGSNANWTMGTAISVLKSSELPELAVVTSRVLSGVGTGSLNNLQKTVFDYDKRDRTSDLHVGYYDFVKLMEELLSEEEKLNEWRRAYDAALVYWGRTPKIYSMSCGMFSMEGANGVSHYIPMDSNPSAASAYRSMQWHQAAGLEQLGW